jgi:protein O-GlcNAc transferase
MDQEFEAVLGLCRAGQLSQARSKCRDILQRDPKHLGTIRLLGTLEFHEQNFEISLRLLDAAIAQDPAHGETHYNRGNTLKALGELEAALSSYDHALNLNPGSVETLINRGNTLKQLGRIDEALGSYFNAVEISPNNAKAQNNLGAALRLAGRHEEALACYETALRLEPHYLNALNNRANLLFELQRPQAALEGFAFALKLKPDYVDALVNRGNVFATLGDHESALRDYEQAYKLAPTYPCLLGAFILGKLRLSDWGGLPELHSNLQKSLPENPLASPPSALLAVTASRTFQRRCAEAWITRFAPELDSQKQLRRVSPHGKIKLAYFTADFRIHPTAFLTAQLFELHDKARFELHAFHSGPNTGDEMQTRIRKAFEYFHDTERATATDISDLAEAHQIDLAIDMSCHTTGARFDAFRLRIAPIQVNYLGYPGTSGASYMDYLIADPVIVPREHRKDYVERIATLPHSYQPNDGTRTSCAVLPERANHDLPESAFVFCCFNNNYKINAEVFDVWMRILTRVPHGVLWLLGEDPGIKDNLVRETIKRGIDPQRIIFGKRLDQSAHLARLGLADLFLDTWPYNAHTTASDSLWAAVPLITIRGESFAGRVGASLLTAVGLPDLIVQSIAEYEAAAVELALAPGKLTNLRSRLAANRHTMPLFDCQTYVRHLESAFEQMVSIARSGANPRDIDIFPSNRHS